MNNYQFLSIAIAYLEIGRVAAKAETELRNDVDYQNAVAYQLLHAVELFYKQMIQNKTGLVSRIHDLEELENEYISLYPNPSHKINHPFDFLNCDSCELNPGEDEFRSAHMLNFKPKFMDQHLRYPADKRTGRYSFGFDDSLFEEIKNKMIDIYADTRESQG